MKLPKITLKGIVFIIAVLVLVASGLIWKFGLINTTTTNTSEEIFLDYIDHGFSDEDRARLEQKIADLENRLSTEPELAADLSQWLQLGNLRYQLGDLLGAKEIYETKILADHPADAPALENLGQTLYEMRDYEGAELRWRAAISVNPWEVTYLKLVNLIETQFPDRQAEIQTILEEAIANIGQNPDLVRRLGDWYFDNGQYDRALSHYQVVKQLLSDDEGIDEKIAETKVLMK